MKGKGLTKMLLTSCFFLILLAGCSGDKTETTTETSSAQQEEGQALDETLVAEGEKIAKSNCIGCHGIDLAGDIGPNLQNIALTKEQIVELLIKGRKTMPPATANGHEEAVAEYLLSLK
ncbi:cytochrome c551/cytochrome c550 [Ureibacillus xyleni]|uniref:Cytochrome c551/cytochrome c550 n=1 Tax=Ureibacillus xyleni TaxID=614648 RepID=A0A285R7E3_9BACL|nr:cytochrome c [Ureibacillus xyleni]SOB90023.1 cytochrome c551/cytochrome c550 [Ureibacillus xyleni]